MNRLGFLLARLFKDETALQNLSRPVLPELIGKRVAVIGNARSLAQTSLGAQIDDHDLIIRINGAPMPSAVSHGSRTDWIAMSTPQTDDLIQDRAPSRLLWMTRKRKRLPWKLATDPRFFLNPVEDITRLCQQLSAPPTTGAMVISLLTQSEASQISLFGFDFFASQSLSGRRTAEQVPHDFDAEAGWVGHLIETDPRLKIHKPLP